MRPVSGTMGMRTETRPADGNRMRLLNIYVRLKLLADDCRGQDLIEYALLAGMVAVAAGAIFPTTVAPSISTIFSKISSSLNFAPGF